MRNAQFDQPGSLLQRTVSLLQLSQKSAFELYRETGLHPHWITGVQSGKFKNPSVNRVQFLFEHLSGTKLVSEG